MNNEHLRLFVRIAVTHNISMAGSELGLSAPVASMHINKLEEALGVKLIHRTTRKVSLTEEGREFLPHAEAVLNAVDSAKASVGAGSFTPQGTIRVAAPSSFARMHIVPALNGFVKQYPELKIDLRQSDSIVDMVEGGFDIAIRNASLNDSTLVARKLTRDHRIVCASPDYIKEYGEPSTPQDLLNHQCINFIGIDSWLFNTPDGLKKIKPKGAIRIDNGESTRDACMNGAGLTLCSIWCAYKALKTGELVQVLKEYPVESDTAIWAVYPSSRLLAPKVRAFIDYFKAYYGDIPYWEA
ncbi:LysR family transcriptional regulator [Pseudoalteromonas sp. MMG013]|uniref:LysR family transcriptional regulator n=1 Tax=Pseudoalteromonas sp. MMG013 TaxID=2822687 RepID=UPI001B3854E5|nr:LysR family transcriptional regulator [Pseudoalteromonas sp. MMG013]MBQ4861528.1 LysR family transcriptional regulator [Pseudoalteromonas sp. MMG013]